MENTAAAKCSSVVRFAFILRPSDHVVSPSRRYRETVNMLLIEDVYAER